MHLTVFLAVIFPAYVINLSRVFEMSLSSWLSVQKHRRLCASWVSPDGISGSRAGLLFACRTFNDEHSEQSFEILASDGGRNISIYREQQYCALIMNCEYITPWRCTSET
jgi:hypothetical protein